MYVVTGCFFFVSWGGPLELSWAWMVGWKGGLPIIVIVHLEVKLVIFSVHFFLHNFASSLSAPGILVFFWATDHPVLHTYKFSPFLLVLKAYDPYTPSPSKPITFKQEAYSSLHDTR